MSDQAAVSVPQAFITASHGRMYDAGRGAAVAGGGGVRWVRCGGGAAGCGSGKEELREALLALAGRRDVADAALCALVAMEAATAAHLLVQNSTSRIRRSALSQYHRGSRCQHKSELRYQRAASRRWIRLEKKLADPQRTVN